AIRIMRACRELGIRSVAVYSDADRDALFAKYADEAFYLGAAPATESYLNIPKIINIAREAGVDAIHPGYGFLSENPDFGLACEKEAIKFIGPSSRTLELTGNKIAAKIAAEKAGVPTVPGTNESITSFEQARIVADTVGFPVIIKPAGGGGGIGMSIVNNEAQLHEALDSSRKIAGTAFGWSDVYIEKYIPHPHHVEFQILADSHGNIVHLGERECSIQRRHQKLIEESPSPTLSPRMRRQMGEAAIAAMKAVGYENAGTVEFIVSDHKFYFIEINARIQVEHAVTEMVTGIDIVKEQIHIASGEPISFQQKDIRINGWAIECRINAEDPLNGFVPSPGKLRGYRSPGGIGVRVDSGVHTRYTIPHLYDPMISKLIVWGRNRQEAIMRMRRALYEYIIVGVKTNIPFHKAVMENPRFVAGDFGTSFIDRESTLLNDMQAIISREKALEDKLSQIFDEKRRVAAATAAAIIAQLHQNAKAG
ncbi:MAG: acetyl-CoA carboxylase biotin carboxylase subunit, partial [Dehalococcoidia bacterium]|nr:acetyl-CoA carboxylase biotin carboxylase subunit [Dehalococcoidia bacterium]